MHSLKYYILQLKNIMYKLLTSDLIDKDITDIKEYQNFSPSDVKGNVVVIQNQSINIQNLNNVVVEALKIIDNINDFYISDPENKIEYYDGDATQLIVDEDALALLFANYAFNRKLTWKESKRILTKFNIHYLSKILNSYEGNQVKTGVDLKLQRTYVSRLSNKFKLNSNGDITDPTVFTIDDNDDNDDIDDTNLK